MKKYKVLTKDLKSPFKGFQFELGKQYICEDFDDSNDECSNGFYATDVEGILYSLNNQKGNKVFEVEVDGKAKEFDQFKQRFEKQTIIREIPKVELEELLKAESKKLDYNFYEACFPFNPLFGKPKEVTDEVKQLFDEWINVSTSVRYSVWNSVWNSVSDSVWNSVRDSVKSSVSSSVYSSVRDSVYSSVSYTVWDSLSDSVRESVSYTVWESMYSYIGSLYPNITKWNEIEHEEGKYPFESGNKLWRMGFVPSFDGTTWRLHSGKNASIVFEKTI